MAGRPGGQTLRTRHGSTGLRKGGIWGHRDGLGSQSPRLREARQLPGHTSLPLNGVRPGAEAAPEERETPILGERPPRQPSYGRPSHTCRRGRP